MPFRPSNIIRQEFARGEQFVFDPGAFEDALAGQGVQFEHWRAIPCPIGRLHKDDTTRATHVDHTQCSNGYLYRRQGLVSGTLTGNSESYQYQDVGAIDGTTAQATMRRVYDDREDREVFLSVADRLYLSDAKWLMPHWETVEHSISGRDRLRFPVECVEDLVDNLNRDYHQGQDFDVGADGYIIWRPGRGPGIDPDAGPGGRGRVYSIWYLFRPYWYISRISHAIRVMKAPGEDGGVETLRAPHQVTIVREAVFEDKERDDDGLDTDPRAEPAPSNDSFAGQ